MATVSIEAPPGFVRETPAPPEGFVRESDLPLEGFSRSTTPEPPPGFIRETKPVSQEFVVESPQPEKSRFNSFENAYNAAQSGIVSDGKFFDTAEQTTEALNQATQKRVETQVKSMDEFRKRRDALLAMAKDDPNARKAINEAFQSVAKEQGVTVTEMDANPKVERVGSEDLKRVFPSMGDKTASVIAGSQRGVAGLSEGMVSPAGLLTMASGAGELKPLATAMGFSFAAHMAANYPEQVKGFGEAIKSGNLQNMVESGIGVVATPYFVKSALTPEKSAIVKTTEEAGAPATAKALDEALKGEGDTGNTKPDTAGLSQTTDKVLSEAEPKVNLETPSVVEAKAAIPAPQEGFVRPEEVKPTETPVAEPEKAKDEARLTELDQQINEASKSVDEPGFEEKIQPLIQEREAIKNKYGGNPPQDNVVAPEATPLSSNPDATGLKISTVDKERMMRGLEALPSAEKRGWSEAIDKANERITADPTYQDRLVAEVKETPRQLTDAETAALTMRRVDLKKGYDESTKRGEAAFEAGDEQAIAEAKSATEDYSNRLSDLEETLKLSKTEMGRGLAALKMMMRDDYSLAALETRKRAANGFRKLTDTERTELTALANDYKSKFEALEKHLSEKESKTSDAALNEAHSEIVKEAVNKPRKTILKASERVVEVLNKRADAARQRIRDRMARTSAGVDPTVLVDLVEIGASHIASGLLDFAKWSAKMVEEYGKLSNDELKQVWESSKKLHEQLENELRVSDVAASIKAKFESGKGSEITSLVQKLAREFVAKGIKDRDKLVDAVHEVLKTVQPEITRRETADAISGYGSFKQLSKDAIDVQLRDLKGQLQQIAKLEDMAKGEAPKKTGVERRIPSDEERGLIKQVEEAKKKGGYNVTNPETQLRSALQAIQTRLENQIADLEKEIATKEKIVKQKSETPTSPEIEALRARRDNLKEQRDAIFGKPEMTDAQRLKAYKTRTTNKIAELEKRIKENDFTKKPKRAPVELDAEGLKLQAALKQSILNIKRAEEADRLKKRTPMEKAQDTFVKWRRAFILSSPVTLAKLTSAAIERMSFTPAEELIGAGIGKIIPKVARKAVREGGISFAAEAKAITDGFTKGMQDAWQILKTGHSELDLIYGKPQLVPREMIDFIGSIHGALKAPAKRNEFARSFQKRVEKALQDGIDVHDPLVQTRLAVEAYKDAEKAIFQQDSRVVSAYKAALARLELKNKATGKAPASAKALTTAAKVLLPIVKVPTNIVAETFQYAAGSVTGSIKLALAMRKGIDKLSPEDADLIMRQLKKGSLGAAVLLLGYLNPQEFGGYYQPGEKRKKDDLKFGGVRIYGMDIPSYLVHNPLLEMLQLGSTIRRVSDSKLKRTEKEPQGLSAGAMAGALGLAEEVPFVREMLEISKAFNPHERGAFFGELAKSTIVPQVFQWTAQQMDQDTSGETVKRNPQTVLQHLETGIPGLRQNVPAKKPQ